MIEQAVARLHFLLSAIPPLLHAADGESFLLKPAPDKWSKQQILGHLIDSACNNHQRFVRIQFEDEPVIFYDQNNWNQHSYYQNRDKRQLVIFWEVYNMQLLQLITCIPDNLLQRKGRAKNAEPATLAWYINDYVAHLEHHLHQLVEYS